MTGELTVENVCMLVFTSPGSGYEHNFPFERQRHPCEAVFSVWRRCQQNGYRISIDLVDSREVKLLSKFHFRIAKGAARC